MKWSLGLARWKSEQLWPGRLGPLSHRRTRGELPVALAGPSPQSHGGDRRIADRSPPSQEECSNTIEKSDATLDVPHRIGAVRRGEVPGSQPRPREVYNRARHLLKQLQGGGKEASE